MCTGLGSATLIAFARTNRRTNLLCSGADPRLQSYIMSESTFNSTPSTSAVAPGSAVASQKPRSTARAVVRWLGRVAVSLLVLLVVGAASIYGLTERRFRSRFAIPDHPIAVSEDAASVVRGEHVATVRGCVECHGAGFSGATMVDQPILGRLAGPNLTLGGRGAELQPRDWERAVRHGVRRDGNPLLFMPANEFTVLTDEDLAAIIAYARSVPPVRQAAPSSYAGPLLRTMYVAGKVKLLAAEDVRHSRAHEARIAAEPTAAYGKYLASGCTGCHGEGFSGGKIPGAPPEWGPAANITPTGIGRWTAADFATALRTGRRPDGTAIDSTLMPIRLLRQMDDVELAALYAYLQSVPPREYGNR
jgi:mono/diheme cytochrome c family protein